MSAGRLDFIVIVAGCIAAGLLVLALTLGFWLLAARGAQISQQQSRQCQADSQTEAQFPAGSVSWGIAHAQLVADGC